MEKVYSKNTDNIIPISCRGNHFQGDLSRSCLFVLSQCCPFSWSDEEERRIFLGSFIDPTKVPTKKSEK